MSVFSSKIAFLFNQFFFILSGPDVKSIELSLKKAHIDAYKKTDEQFLSEATKVYEMNWSVLFAPSCFAENHHGKTAPLSPPFSFSIILYSSVIWATVE